MKTFPSSTAVRPGLSVLSVVHRGAQNMYLVSKIFTSVEEMLNRVGSVLHPSVIFKDLLEEKKKIST